MTEPAGSAPSRAAASLDANQVDAIAKHEGIDAGLVRTINDAAVRRGVDPLLLLAVGKQETDFGRSPAYNEMTGRGDNGHGYGKFQLDDRTRGRESLLPLVAHDDAKAADVAAQILFADLRASHGNTAEALRTYNGGSPNAVTSLATYAGKRLHYEDVVERYSDEYRQVVEPARGNAPAHDAHAPQLHAPLHDAHAAQELLNVTIAASARAYDGHVTKRDATHHEISAELDRTLEHGNLACAWSVNQVLKKATGREFGSNTLSATSIGDELRTTGGREVSRAESKAGDIAVRYPSHREPVSHVGIVVADGATAIVSNSSSRGSFGHPQTAHSFSNGGDSPVHYFRISPAAVDMHEVEAASRRLDVRALLASPAHGGRTVASDERAERPVPRTSLPLERRHGEVLETAAEVEAKNAILRKGIDEAHQHRVDLSLHYVGNGRESKETVARQNAELREEMLANLPEARQDGYRQSGRILQVKDGVILQDVGRGRTAAYSERDFAAVPTVGSHVVVGFENGHGSSTPVERTSEHRLEVGR